MEVKCHIPTFHAHGPKLTTRVHICTIRALSKWVHLTFNTWVVVNAMGGPHAFAPPLSWPASCGPWCTSFVRSPVVPLFGLADYKESGKSQGNFAFPRPQRLYDRPDPRWSSFEASFPMTECTKEQGSLGEGAGVDTHSTFCPGGGLLCSPLRASAIVRAVVDTGNQRLVWMTLNICFDKEFQFTS